MREADDLTPFMCRMSWKSGSLNLLEPSGPHRACYGTNLPLHVPCYIKKNTHFVHTIHLFVSHYFQLYSYTALIFVMENVCSKRDKTWYIYIYIYIYTRPSYDIKTSYILSTRCTNLCCMIFSPNIDCFDIQHYICKGERLFNVG